MKNSQYVRAFALCVGLVLVPLSAAVSSEAVQTQEEGRLRIAVYNDFPPYSHKGTGVDISIGEALAERMGLRADIVSFTADEDMSDDLRNMVWKGHYLGTRPADVMLHVPVDQHLAERNDQVRIFGPYHLETVAIARDPSRIGPVTGSAANAMEVFTREKIGVETASLADDFLLGVLHGRLRNNVTHFTTVADAVAALQQGEVAAVMSTRTELEGALGKQERFQIGPVDMPELRIKGWPLGMAVKANDPALADALSQAMIDIQRDGTLARIFAEHGVSHRTP